MTMAIIPAQTGRISGIFWRRPVLGLFLLLLGPLMWFGIVYLGSLLTLLWQSIYTFDDFTMSVTSDFTLANLRALFNPANYDIIVRTLVMALCVTLVSALLALPMAWYMALHQRQNEGLLLYRGHAANVGQLYRQSLCVGAAAGERWRGAVVPRSSWTGGGAERAVERPGGWRQYLVHLRPWTLSGVRLHLAAVYDPAGAGGAGAYSGIVATGLGRSRRGPAADLSLRGAAALPFPASPLGRSSPFR